MGWTLDSRAEERGRVKDKWDREAEHKLKRALRERGRIIDEWDMEEAHVLKRLTKRA